MAVRIKYLDKTAGILGSGAATVATYTCVAADDTANYVDFDLAELGTLKGAIVQVRDSTGKIRAADFTITLNHGSTNGKLRVADGSSATIAVNDVLTVIAFTA